MKRWMIAALVAAVALATLGTWASAEDRPVSEVVAEATAAPAAEPVEPVPAPAVELDNGKIVIDLPVWWAAVMSAVESIAKYGWQLAFTFLGGLLIKRIKDTKTGSDLTLALEVGVNHAWQTIGKAWKAAHEDGKFTTEEKGKLRSMALKAARDIATGPALKILKTLGQEFLEAKISGIVEKRKAVARKS